MHMAHRRSHAKLPKRTALCITDLVLMAVWTCPSPSIYRVWAAYTQGLTDPHVNDNTGSCYRYPRTCTSIGPRVAGAEVVKAVGGECMWHRRSRLEQVERYGMCCKNRRACMRAPLLMQQRCRGFRGPAVRQTHSSAHDSEGSLCHELPCYSWSNITTCWAYVTGQRMLANARPC